MVSNVRIATQKFVLMTNTFRLKGAICLVVGKSCEEASVDLGLGALHKRRRTEVETRNLVGFWRRLYGGRYLVCFYVQLSPKPLAVLKDWSVTWGMKNTLPLAAVENIGQLTRVRTRILRG